MAVRASSTQERQQEAQGADRGCERSRTFVVEETIRIVRTRTRQIHPQEEERSRSTPCRSSRRRSWTFLVGLCSRTTSRSLLDFARSHPRSSHPRSRSLLVLPTPRFLPLPSSSTPAAAATALLPNLSSSAAPPAATTAAADLPSPDLPSELHLVRGTIVGWRSRRSGRTA